MPSASRRRCDVVDCGRPHQARGLCQPHDRRRRAGEPDWDRPVEDERPQPNPVETKLAAAAAGTPLPPASRRGLLVLADAEAADEYVWTGTRTEQIDAGWLVAGAVATVLGIRGLAELERARRGHLMSLTPLGLEAAVVVRDGGAWPAPAPVSRPVRRRGPANEIQTMLAAARTVRLSEAVLAAGMAGPYETVLRARVDRPEASLAELAAGLGLTKDSYASALRRALAESSG